ncbi:UNVERIFIED_CONTAM: hypothetical protein RMT77_017676 [Armadillidium vulgare]
MHFYSCKSCVTFCLFSAVANRELSKFLLTIHLVEVKVWVLAAFKPFMACLLLSRDFVTLSSEFCPLLSQGKEEQTPDFRFHARFSFILFVFFISPPVVKIKNFLASQISKGSTSTLSLGVEFTCLSICLIRLKLFFALHS